MKQRRYNAGVKDRSRRGSTIKPKSTGPRVADMVDQTPREVVKGRSWLEIAGMAPDLLDGQDAQEWVDELRGGNGHIRKRSSVKRTR